ncbi:hypothetical protein [Nonomuraea candida]|uniref:hypothetical protein n=1 Tax=Nonomuraea candida TaxID=359159 RepID=UPI0005B85D63|nr:hypothetical protein [Nonomuraea candida]
MADRKIDPLVLRRMFEEGKTYREIATYFNVTISGVQQAAEKMGLRRQTVSHKKYIPWTVDVEHRQTGPITNLRNLSKVAQGQQVPLAKLNTGLRWATRLYEDGLDIDYDRTIGFYERPANEDNWHIKMVLKDVGEALKPSQSQ